METLEELKAIIENAPNDGAADESFINWHYIRGRRSLSDIKRIIELMEINEAMHKQVAGYLTGADWQHWQDFNKSKFEVMK